MRSRGVLIVLVAVALTLAGCGASPIQQEAGADRTANDPVETNVPGFTDPIPAGTEVFDVPQDLLIKQGKQWSDAYDALARGAPQAQG